MAKEKFERSKPHVNIGTIGHVDHSNPDHCSLDRFRTDRTKSICDRTLRFLATGK